MYDLKYIESIHHGMVNSSYKISGKKVKSTLFYNEINKLLKSTQKKSGRIFFAGNGASAAISNHMALDWSKNGGILAFSLSDSALFTALSNDYTFESSIVEFFKINSIDNNDVVFTTSSSGNSSNIVNILNFCKKNKIKTLSFSGLNKNNISEKTSDFSIFVPSKTYGMVECIHQVFHHLILDKFMKIEEWNKNESQNMDSKNFKL